MSQRLPVRNPFDAAYAGTPPWEIGRAQPAFVTLDDQGLVHDRILDLGCGTGDLAIELASRGHSVIGIDASGLAIDQARAKAAAQQVGKVRFEVADVLTYEGGRFYTVIDCGLFHTLTDEGRSRYERSAARLVAPGGALHILCFSDRQPGTMGPRRISEGCLRRTFRKGWLLSSLRPERYISLFHPQGAHAWLATLARMPVTTLVH